MTSRSWSVGRMAGEGPQMAFTRYPACRAAQQREAPIRPLERLLRYLTGSMALRVGPRVMRAVRPLGFLKNEYAINSKINSGSIMRPRPSSPQAVLPVVGPRSRMP